MAHNSTVVKAELQVSDMDRQYYATHALTLAQHPSETDARLMVRLLAFALYADDKLEFGRGLSSDDEPDLWRRGYTGEIDLWIDLGHPSETRIKKACARAKQVVVVNYGGNSSDIWWNKIASSLTRLRNLTVLDIPSDVVDALPAIGERGMRLNALLQDGELQLMGDRGSIELRPAARVSAASG